MYHKSPVSDKSRAFWQEGVKNTNPISKRLYYHTETQKTQKKQFPKSEF